MFFFLSSHKILQHVNLFAKHLLLKFQKNSHTLNTYTKNIVYFFRLFSFYKFL
nr:MAG TPA: hypothetical protein [Caudoviricetes sp.]